MGIAVESWLKSRGWILQRQGVTQTTFNLFAHKGNPNPKLVFYLFILLFININKLIIINNKKKKKKKSKKTYNL